MTSPQRPSECKASIRMISLALVSIFLTLASPATSFSAETCRSLFSRPLSTSPAKTVQLQMSDLQKKAANKWQGLANRITTYPELITFLNRISQDLRILSHEEIRALQNINLIAIVKRLSPADTEKVVNFIGEIVTRVDSRASRSELADWLYPLQFYFFPEKILNFIKSIEPMSRENIRFQEAFSGHLGLWGLNHTFATAVSELPADLKFKVSGILRDRLLSIPLESELMSMNGSQLKIPCKRTYRRNLEVMAFFLSKARIDLLRYDLENSQSETDIVLFSISGILAVMPSKSVAAMDRNAQS